MLQAIIADHDKSGIDSISRLLDCERFDIKIIGQVSTGKELLELIHLNRPEIVISDIHFPDSDIFDVIQKTSDSNVNTHYFIISESTTFTNVRTALQLKVEDFLPKPTSRPELNRAIRTIVNRLQFNGTEYASYSRIIAVAKSYIDLNFDHNITLKDIADSAFISSSYLGTLFHKELGINYKDYLTSVRMREACRLLNNPRYSVKEVGFMVGYQDTKHFRQCFTKHTGITPVKFRKR